VRWTALCRHARRLQIVWRPLASWIAPRRDEAMAEYKKASEPDPKNANAHYNLADVLADLGRRDEAMAEYKKASELDPKNAPAILILPTEK
jgi:tetratricopeptide (TPR) repeat protein